MMYKREDLVKQTTKQLLGIAKSMNVVGRHNMRKEHLINAIVNANVETENVNVERTSVVKSTKEIKDVEADLVSASCTREWEESIGETFEEMPIASLPKPKEDYINNAKIGTLVAFKVNNVKVLSGMIEEIRKLDFLIRTKSGVRFTVRKRNIIWVKTGPRWPRGVYLALKGETTPDGEYKTAN